jgi:hypothetical protein
MELSVAEQFGINYVASLYSEIHPVDVNMIVHFAYMIRNTSTHDSY